MHSRHDLNNDEDNNIIGYSASKLKPNLGEVGYKDVIKGIDEVITKITEVNDLNLELRHLFGKTIKHLDETGWFEKWNNNYQK